MPHTWSTAAASSRLLVLLLLLSSSSCLAADDDSIRMMKELFEIKDRYTAARLNNKQLDSFFRSVSELEKKDIEMGATAIVGMLKSLQINPGNVNLTGYLETVYEYAAATDGGSLKLSGG